MSGKVVRTYTVTPEFWNDQPETAAKLLAERTREHPDDFWLVMIASREGAQAFMETNLWHFAPAEAIEP